MTQGPSDTNDEHPLDISQKRLIGFIIVLAVTNVAYRLIYVTGEQRTAALFIGVPTILSIGLAALPRSRSATGMLIKGSTLALLIACVVLPEGLLCLIFALPLVAIVAVVVGGTIDFARRTRRGDGPALMIVSIPLLLMSLEGVIGTPFDTHDAAVASIEVIATPDQVRAALAATPAFKPELPPFLQVGFNRPVSATGSGIAVGDQRTIEFNGGTHDDHPLRLFGLTGERSVEHSSHTYLRVITSEPGRVVFDIDKDTTMLSRWVDLRTATVTWEAIDENTTRVSWQFDYQRLIYPTLYFAPLERYGMSEAAGYLLESVIEEQLQ